MGGGVAFRNGFTVVEVAVDVFAVAGDGILQSVRGREKAAVKVAYINVTGC